MGRHDWYRCKAWTLAERALFDQKIARSRQAWSTWQYFHTQAHVLWWHGTSGDAKSEATRLLERALVEVRDIDPDWAAATLHDLGMFALQMGDRERAVQRFQESIAMCPGKKRRVRNETTAEEELAKLAKPGKPGKLVSTGARRRRSSP